MEYDKKFVVCEEGNFGGDEKRLLTPTTTTTTTKHNHYYFNINSSSTRGNSNNNKRSMQHHLTTGQLVCTWQIALLLGMMVGAMIYVNLHTIEILSIERMFLQRSSGSDSSLHLPRSSPRRYSVFNTDSLKYGPLIGAPPDEKYEQQFLIVRPVPHLKDWQNLPQHQPPVKTSADEDKDSRIPSDVPPRCLENYLKFLHQPPPYSNIFKLPRRCPKWHSWAAENRKCILSEWPNSPNPSEFFREFNETLTCCLRSFLDVVHRFHSKGPDLDLIMPQEEHLHGFNVSAVSIGINPGTEWERALLRARPNTKIFIADPQVNSSRSDSVIVDQLAVSGTSGTASISIRDPKTRRLIQTPPMSVLGLRDYLLTLIPPPEPPVTTPTKPPSKKKKPAASRQAVFTWDYLFINTDGGGESTYNILEAVARTLKPPRSIRQPRFEFCQITVVIRDFDEDPRGDTETAPTAQSSTPHPSAAGPQQKWTSVKVNALMRRLIGTTDYMPILSVPKRTNDLDGEQTKRHQLTFINTQAMNCVHRYHVGYCNW